MEREVRAAEELSLEKMPDPTAPTRMEQRLLASGIVPSAQELAPEQPPPRTSRSDMALCAAQHAQRPRSRVRDGPAARRLRAPDLLVSSDGGLDA